MTKHSIKKIGNSFEIERNWTVISGHMKSSFLLRPLRITNQMFPARRTFKNQVKVILTFCSQDLIVNGAYETWYQQLLRNYSFLVLRSRKRLRTQPIDERSGNLTEAIVLYSCEGCQWLSILHFLYNQVVVQ